MLQMAYMVSPSFFYFQHLLHKSQLRRRGRACQNLKSLPNSRKPNPRVWRRSHLTGSWMGSCLSSVGSKTLSEVSWGKRLWKWGPNTNLIGHPTPHTSCKCEICKSAWINLFLIIRTIIIFFYHIPNKKTSETHFLFTLSTKWWCHG